MLLGFLFGSVQELRMEYVAKQFLVRHLMSGLL